MDWTDKTWINKTWIDKTWIKKTWINKTWIDRTWINKTWIYRTLSNSLTPLGHVRDLAPLQPSQTLTYPFSPKQAFLTIKKTHLNAEKATLTEKTKKLNSLFSRNKLKP